MNPAQVGALLSAGRAHDALAAARRGASENPSHPQWLLVLGASLHATGASEEAASALRTAVDADARNPVAWNALGAVLVELGETAKGEEALREALRLDANYLDARFNLALALKQRGDFGAARAELERALEREPRSELARFELASVLVAEGEAEPALRMLESLRARHPNDARILANIAAAQARLGREEAAASCERALAAPNLSARDVAAVAHTLALLGRLPEARAAARRINAMAPAAGKVAASDSRALVQLANALTETGALDEAIALLSRALEGRPRSARLLSIIVKAKGMACDWDGMDGWIARLREAALASSDDPADPQTALHLAEVGAAEQRAWAERWARVKFPSRGTLHAPREPARGRRLRIGYLSSDFWDHATALLMAGMLEHHDRGRFEVFAYSTGREDESEVRRRIAASVEHFVQLGAAPGEQAARRIAGDRLDLLFDLGGYVKSSRIDILAWRPAPLQGHFLGYPGTTGADFVDVLVADAVVAPHGREGDFSERLLRMPACYQPNDPRRTDPPARSRRELGFADDAIVLCSFNQSIKIRPEIFAPWCDLLQALPKALLWLADPGAAAQPRLRRFASSRGIDPGRIVFAPYVAQEEHMARLRSADIALDTFPYGSHTTASDAVWAGVPMVALTGETFASRVSTSVLRAAGCGEWAFGDPARAFEATLALARDARLREEARKRLAAARSSALFDAAAFARDFEALMERAMAQTP